MGRKGIEVESLYGFTTESLKKMRNSHESEFARNVLTAVAMRYEGFSTIKIAKFLLKSKQTIIDYIKKWNSVGLKALEDHRGGSEGTFTAEMLDDLINTVLHTLPNDFGFIGNVWTCPLLVEYIYQNYGEKYSKEYIRILLKRNNLSYKRAQRKPTKADKVEQEAFKKNEIPSTYCRKLF
ncbi:winged helix-turn-helix domain-containing protein [Clostridium sp. OS1-26]|uniref:helix-turn-helix domain-containing protein n=1 Tax=Clostridium sp. OS1-26 TaxID=3070681 RepID=UPI0027DEC25E|nr:winged helix-turn-helix domain-containing protein [Clostridium sp. OS1-26]WML34703.1 winged helix-turn-helix domain-containing protein [Clostridium sp. OS1-26]WML37541.1 winged helix-turn-helix domain-containing protein [Clostridium sp. OS1-26]